MLFLKYFIFLLLLATSISTKNAPGSPSLLLANHDDILYIPANDPNNTMTIVDGLKQALACDFIYEDHLVFWISAWDHGKGKLQYVNMSNPQHKKMNVLVSGMAMPDGLACDWIGKKLYWTDAESNRIEVSELNGTSRKVLIWSNLDQPRAIAVDPHNGYMFWTDWGEEPKIERAGLDGTGRRILANENMYWPNGITIDYDEQKIYWVEANYHFIHRMNMDGTNREEVANSKQIQQALSPPPSANANATTISPKAKKGRSEQSDAFEHEEDQRLLGALQHPFAITLFKDRIYWTDWVTNSVHSMLKNGSGVPTVVKGSRNGDLSPMDVQVYNSERQKPGRNPCGTANGGCSHLCLLSPHPPGYRCACPTGVQMLDNNNKTCKNGPKDILIFARRADLRVISLDTEDYTDVLVPVDVVQHAVALDYDPVDGFVYWTDDDRKAISRSRLNGTGTEAVVTDSVEQSDGVAVDWIARNLYWTDTGRDYIAVSRLNGTSRKILINTDMQEPRAIVLDPVAGQMYWTDWGIEPKIERASLDGTDRVVMVKSQLGWPNGLAIDHHNGHLYWADAHVDRIEVIALNGTGRKTVLSGRLPHVFGLSLLGDHLYWTDWQRRRIERMKIGERATREILRDQLPDVMGIKAISLQPPSGTNPCAVNNGGCSHLCLYTPRGPGCHCPTGLELAPNMLECIVPKAFLLFSVSKLGMIRGISLDTAQGNSRIPFQNKVDAAVLDFSVTDDMIYWTDHNDMKISRAFRNGSGVETFVDIGLEMLEGLAVDWIGRNVYWSDSTTNRIEVSKMDGTSRRPIIWENLESPRSLAMDPANGYIYWSEWGTIPCIKRSEMDGSNPVKITEDGTVGRANSLTIDYEAQRLFFVDLDINEIISMDMTSEKDKDLVQVVQGKNRVIFTLTIYGEYVYWSDSKGKCIERANKISGKNGRVIESGLTDIDDMLVYHASRQSGVTACSRSNGGCQHLCLSLHGGRHTCSCPAHYTLNSDNVTCTAPENFILVSQKRYLSRIVFESSTGQLGVVPGEEVTNRGSQADQKKTSVRPSPDAVLPVRGIKDACAVDYDPIDKRVYWLDCKRNEIVSARPNGTEVRVLLGSNNGSHMPYDLAVDPYSRSLYWTDSMNNSINLMRLDGSVVGTVLSGFVPDIGSRKKAEEIMPRKIAVDPYHGRLYFTNACRDVKSCRFKIVQSSLDGSDPMVLFNRGLHNVSALVVDFEAERLYWADQSKIETSKLDGKDRAPFVQTGLTQPVGLAVFGQNLYWVDAQADNGLIEGADKIDASNRRKIQGRMHNLRDIVAVVEMNKNSLKNHPCSIDNGGCSHICVPQSDGTTRCSCPDHLVLKGTFACDVPSTCSPNHFTCRRRHDCVPLKWRCDGAAECADGTDEEDCPTCEEGQFQCGSTSADHAMGAAAGNNKDILHVMAAAAGVQCFDEKRKCDGVSDCLDRSDEMNCGSCEQNEFECSSGLCVPESVKCDGNNDCSDWSDEDCPASLGRMKSSNATEQNRGRHVSLHATPSSSSSEQDNTYIIIIGICSGLVLLVVLIAFLRHCMSNNTPQQVPVVYFAPDSTGQLNFNLDFQSHADASGKTGQRRGANGSSTGASGGRKKGSGTGQPHPTINFSILPAGSGAASHAKGFPVMMHPAGMHASLAPWPGYPYALHGNQTVVMERPGIPGASSSSSSKTMVSRYPQTWNPPPSPVTDRSGSKSADCLHSSDSHSTRTPHHKCKSGHRHRRHQHRANGPPPPTPCTTEDTCDDTETCSKSRCRSDKRSGSSKSGASGSSVPCEPPPPYYGHSCCHHCYYHQYNYCSPPSRHRHSRRCEEGSSSSSSRDRCSDALNSESPDCSCGEQPYPNVPPAYYGAQWPRMGKRRYKSKFGAEMNSDTDPFAPPPTPHSQYLSECYTHGETTEADEPLDREGPPRRNSANQEVEDITNRMQDETDRLLSDASSSRGLNDDDEDDEEGRTTDDADTVLLAPSDRAQSARTSPSMTEHSFCFYNPPPSPVTDSS